MIFCLTIKGSGHGVTAGMSIKVEVSGRFFSRRHAESFGADIVQKIGMAHAKVEVNECTG